MTQEERLIRTDRMRFTNDKLSANLVLVAIVFDVLYFVSIYKSDVGNYYYTMLTGGSIIYNLIFLLAAFLASEGVKSRKSGFTPVLLALAVGQFIRMFIIPAKAHAAVISIKGAEVTVMGDGQYARCLIYLGISGVCCAIAAVTSLIQYRTLTEYQKTLEQNSSVR